MNDSLQDLMREARRLTRAGRLNEGTEVIQRALRSRAEAGAAPVGVSAALLPTIPPLLQDSPVTGADVPTPDAPITVVTEAPTGGFSTDELKTRLRSNQIDIDAEVETGAGEFTSGSHTQASLTRRFKLYAPPGHAGRALPLVVMLHGCTQDPDDFAAGTGMNELAREQGFFVLYPAQSQDANASRCWNWFQHNHQQRGSGEPALLASLTQAVMAQHGIDARRVYIAGLSAGGAMAAIVAAAYPDIFAAAGVHSGLPRGAAGNIIEALAAMKGGGAGLDLYAKAGRIGNALGPPQILVPTIVFHGDQDQTVHPRNGEQLIAAVLGDAAGAGDTSAWALSRPQVEEGVSSQGRRYTRSIHHDGDGNAVAEYWLVHGAGHAWSGGNANGSYTEPKGPDATRAMLRFFFGHPHRLDG